MKQSGIYRIRNIVNGKPYLGSAKRFINRWQRHRTSLRKGIHHSILLQRAWNKYGEEAFKFEIIEIVENPTKKKLLQREQYWIDHYDSANKNKGYNILPTAGSRFGIHDEQIKQDKEDILNFCIKNKVLPYKRSKNKIERRLGKRLEEFKRKMGLYYDEKFAKKVQKYLTKRKLKVFLDKQQLKEFVHKYKFIPSQISKNIKERKLAKIWFIYTWIHSDCYDSSLAKELRSFPIYQEYKRNKIKKEILDFVVKNKRRPNSVSLDSKERKFSEYCSHYINFDDACYDKKFTKYLKQFPTWRQFKNLQKV